MIREDIAVILGEIDIDLTKDRGFTEAYQAKADQILSLITTEIEKVENPHDADVLGNGRLTGDLPFALYNGFEDCRQSILNLLKEQK